ncbi:sigma-70 family RNA polymerase sigma factor [Nodosilinea sp. LEGE 07088]|uniref:sigma-70 family RNA polymerase sigma factor n=1 Tax=Nodosilinea sp. LEGE 07088 TaxID=2777968 RepID=UPI00187F8547|nr:sigma-70 family RNA polymerase sigma factor [Nodosilinea sp. LEGE 07088]MBE9136378.1 sigma-70 family RNA polymerase sigma factor [Nodosilinea sp. LEGE 07088]
MPTANQNPQQSGHNKLVDEFVAAVSYLLMPDEFKGTSLYKFLICFVRQWHIPHVDLDEVIIEGIKRGIEYIHKHNQPIRKPESWLRQVCLNILRTKVDVTIKEERKAERLTTLAQHSRSPLIESELIEQLEFLEKALNKLSREEQSLIRMKFLQRKTYEQIRQHYKYIAEGEDKQAPTVQALRKRESRALKRLKEHFFSLYEGGARSKS